MTRFAWVTFITSAIMTASLIAALFTDNEDWLLNIPLSIVIGIPFGLATYGLLNE